MTEETRALALQIVKALDGSDSGAVCFDAYNDVAYLDTEEAVTLITPILAAALTSLARDLATARQERDAAMARPGFRQDTPAPEVLPWKCPHCDRHYTRPTTEGK